MTGHNGLSVVALNITEDYVTNEERIIRVILLALEITVDRVEEDKWFEARLRLILEDLHVAKDLVADNADEYGSIFFELNIAAHKRIEYSDRGG